MLKSWSIKNFKPIVDSGELQLAPVTVLAGRNSSGKSSLLQSILMIAQTLGSRLLDRPLLPNERIVQLGTFEDILNVDSGEKSLNIIFDLAFDEEDQYHSGSPFAVFQSIQVNMTYNSDKNIELSLPTIESSKAILEKVSLQIHAARVPFYHSSRSSVKRLIEFAIRKASNQEIDLFIQHIPLSKRYMIRNIKQQEKYFGYIESNTQELLVDLFHFLPVRIIKEDSTDFTLAFDGQYITGATEETIKFFTSRIRYLGPSRADPQATQKFSPSSELDDIGSRGEYAAAVYDANQSAEIEWFNPFSQLIEQGSLKDALNNWVRYLQIAEQVQIEAAGQSGFSWQVVQRKGLKPLPLSYVGVGTSQLLPILVMGLLSPIGSLLIIEQPELHLHPYVQARLGDFFMGLAKCKKQCLIETHSENLVSQLRLHIVEAGGLEKSNCMVYFVDQDEQGAAKFEQIKVSPNGNILNWPDGFFDETMLQEDRITAASLRKRAQEAKYGS